MSSRFSFSERFLTAEHDQRIFANQCLKRKLEAGERNGFAAVGDNEMCDQQEQSIAGEKRPRFSEHSAQTPGQLETDINRNQSMNGELASLNFFSSASNADICPNVSLNGNNSGVDSLLQNNLDWKLSSGNEEVTGMDIESETDGMMERCPPNLNCVVPDHSTPCSSTECSPTKGSPAREFLQKHRPEYQMHCIPSYCHPGGLWDVMLEVYHGI